MSPRGLHGSAMIVSVGVPRGCWAKALLVVTATSAAVVLLAGCTDDALPQGTTSSPAPAAAERSASQPPGPSLMTCGSTSPETRPPEWAVTDAGVPGDIPTAVSKNGLVSATIFANPLHAPARPSGAANKILWVVKLPREGLPLTITATPLDHNGPAVTINEPADSGPGEIYPSIVGAVFAHGPTLTPDRQRCALYRICRTAGDRPTLPPSGTPDHSRCRARPMPLSGRPTCREAVDIGGASYRLLATVPGLKALAKAGFWARD